MDTQSAASQPLRQRLAQFLAQELDAPTFCACFENTYNMETDKAALTESEHRTFERLFDEVVYFSPFPDERASIPNYRGEDEILKAAREAQAGLA